MHSDSATMNSECAPASACTSLQSLPRQGPSITDIRGVSPIPVLFTLTIPPLISRPHQNASLKVPIRTYTEDSIESSCKVQGAVMSRKRQLPKREHEHSNSTHPNGCLHIRSHSKEVPYSKVLQWCKAANAHQISLVAMAVKNKQTISFFVCLFQHT